jgi:coenzyme F420-0:L-glutamate ligase/coenzyme F420-1:gamma-L-glutamate ligase
LLDALAENNFTLEDQDIVVVTSKVVSKAEGRFLNLSQVVSEEQSKKIAQQVEKTPQMVQAVLNESEKISRMKAGVLIVKHRLGFVSANAGIDASNVGLPDEDLSSQHSQSDWVVLMPENPDQSAMKIRNHVQNSTRKSIGVIVSDSQGRPFRRGTVGIAVGIAGLNPLWDGRGEKDLFGRQQQHTLCAVADSIASAADLVAGQGAEGFPFVIVRGFRFAANENAHMSEMYRLEEEDLYL